MTPPKGLAFAFSSAKIAMYSVGGAKLTPGPEAPTFMIGLHESEPLTADLRVAAEGHFAGLKVYDKKQIRSSEELTTASGMKGYALVGDGVDPKSGASLSLYQVYWIDGKSQYFAIAAVGRKDAAQWLPLFKEAAQSLKKRG